MSHNVVNMNSVSSASQKCEVFFISALLMNLHMMMTSSVFFTGTCALWSEWNRCD